MSSVDWNSWASGEREVDTAQARRDPHAAAHTSVARESSGRQQPIRIICISDTHNKRPKLPLGDVLIHAGDLTQNGTFKEVQREIDWLSSQPHQHKILVAGNHDLLFDEAFLSKHPHRQRDRGRTRHELNFGSVIYLQDTMITLDFPAADGASSPRKLSIFGSPWTPEHGVWAFQYPPTRTKHWSRRFSRLDVRPDIVVTHGPPRNHLDLVAMAHVGCPYLADEIYKIRPRLVVFGHVHVGHGRQDNALLRWVPEGYHALMAGSPSWSFLLHVIVRLVWRKLLAAIFGDRDGDSQSTTTFVNAAMVGGRYNVLMNSPVIVDI